MIKRYLTILTIACVGFNAKAQIDFGTFLEAGVADANKIMESYLEPAFLGFGYGINSGWYNTAKPHKLLGIDITPTVTMALVPTDAEFFTINPNEFSNISLNPNSTTDQAPTLFGPNLPAPDLPLLDYTSGGNAVAISSPTGLGLEEEIPFNAVPSGMIQVGIGIIKNTDIKFRIVPTIESEGEFEFSMFGIGVMHDLKQWIPGLKQVPLDFSGFAGWNRISARIFLDEDNPDQVSEFNTNGFTLQGIASKKLAIFTFFGGVGFSTTTTNFSLLGEYETQAGTFTDPIAFDYSSGGPRINLGMRIKLLILTLHADYAIQKYNTLTLGAGISIR